MLVAALLVAVTTLLFGAFGAVEYFIRYDGEFERLRRVTKAQTTELAAALAVPVWNIDRAQIDHIIDSQAEVMSIEAIVVKAAGKTHARARDANRRFVESDGVFPVSGLLAAERPIVYEGETIGTVRVFTTPALIRQQLRLAAIRTGIAILVVDLLLIASVYFVLWLIVLRPVRNIETFAGDVSAGRTSDAPVVTGPSAELRSLRTSIERMVRQLDERYAALKVQMAKRLESEERFRTIFDSVNDAIFIDDVDGTILNVNAKACEMFGYSRDEALALDIGKLSSGVDPYTQERGIARVREAIAGRELMFEWHARHRTGRLFWTEISTRVATIDGSRRLLLVVRDIDERKAMERELRRRETMAAMGSLVAGVAHEVRNPLFGMTALLDAYADALSTPDLVELSVSLREQVMRLTHVTRELLEFGTPLTMTLVPSSLGDLVDEAIEGRASAAAKAKIIVSNTIDRALPKTPMDRARMRQVFDNLLDNALQHSRSSVTFAASRVQDGARAWIDCTVEDDGDGFRPDDLDHVFEPFFTRRERGIGLGMSVVQRIVEEHAGRVTAGNRPEGGAVVTVRLPAAAS